MLLLAGFMGLLAVGVTAFVGYDIATRGDSALEEYKTAADTSYAVDLTSAPAKVVQTNAELPIRIVKFHQSAHLEFSGLTTETTETVFGSGHGEVRQMPALANFGNAQSPTARLNAVEEANLETLAHLDEISGFSATDDRLIIYYNALADAVPLVALEDDAENPTRRHVTLNGIRVASVVRAEGLTLDHITLVPEGNEARLTAA